MLPRTLNDDGVAHTGRDYSTSVLFGAASPDSAGTTHFSFVDFYRYMKAGPISPIHHHHLGPMLDALGLFKRNINQLFGICVDIMNTGRSLQLLSSSMQILAINGVAQAAKVGGGKGRPILALVEILNHTPREIKPEVEAIEQVCAELARLTAHSSNIVWRYYQLITSVLAAMPQGGQSSCLADRHLPSHLRFTTPEDITRLMTDPSFQLGEPLERDNRSSIAAICQTNLTELHARLSEALRCLNDTRRALHGLKMIGLTARYLAFCISSEAAALGEAGMSFKTLAAEIGHVVDELDARMRAMKSSIDSGQSLVELLLKGNSDAK